jgi:F-type H+-transporting ATPase subunit epsilon
MSHFNLTIVTPERCFFTDEVDMVIVNAAEGEMAVLKNRAPIITPLKTGKIRIFNDGGERVAAVVDGYINVGVHSTIVVTNAAEWPEEIDVERALEAKKRAEESLKRDKGKDIVQAQLALRRALNRLEVAKMSKYND